MWLNKYPLCYPDPEMVGGQGQEQQLQAAQQAAEQGQSDENPEKPEELNNQVQKGNEKYNDIDPKEPTRGKMASVFISGFFMVIFLCFVYAGWKQASLDELKDTIIAVIGAMSGLIGFVIGYYFKTKD